MIQYEGIDNSAAAIQTLNGCLLQGSAQPLLVRFADSPAEKAAKAARKEKTAQTSISSRTDEALQQYIAGHVQLQQQLLEMVRCMHACAVVVWQTLQHYVIKGHYKTKPYSFILKTHHAVFECLE